MASPADRWRTAILPPAIPALTTRRTASEPWPERWLPSRESNFQRYKKSADPTSPPGNGRVYKPLGSPLFNLPGAFVDEISDFDLSRRADLRRAHELADLIPRDEDENECDVDYEERIRDVHLALWHLAKTAPQIRAELNRLAAERELRAQELQRSWSAHHERKANRYWLPPLQYAPINDKHLMPAGPRETFER